MKGCDIIKCRVLQKGTCEVTQWYGNNGHSGIDIVGSNYTIDKIVAHSDGIISYVQDGYDNMRGSTGSASYGNYIKIEHGNGMTTLYAHLAKGINLKKGQKVSKGQFLADMSDSGNAYGAHLHFEVQKDNTKIDPTKYLDKELNTASQAEKTTNKLSIGTIVTINGVYTSSTSTKKLTPLIKSGKITRIIENAPNPYLLNDGNIGWINESCIIDSILEEETTNYLSNPNYTGFSIVDALKDINIDSSYNHRMIIAKLNNIENYTGTSIQNTQMLNLLKQGKLKYKQ